MAAVVKDSIEASSGLIGARRLYWSATICIVPNSGVSKALKIVCSWSELAIALDTGGDHE